MRLQLSDIGGWLFRCDRAELPEDLRATPIGSRCAVPTYRLRLIQPGQPVALWVTGPSRATPPPGVWMVGYTTGEVRVDPSGGAGSRGRAQVLLRHMVPLASPLSRAHLATLQSTASMEVLRQPFGSNPSYLTPGEQVALRGLIGGWPGTGAAAGP